jgi:hypothetical protein
MYVRILSIYLSIYHPILKVAEHCSVLRVSILRSQEVLEFEAQPWCRLLRQHQDPRQGEPEPLQLQQPNKGIQVCMGRAALLRRRLGCSLFFLGDVALELEFDILGALKLIHNNRVRRQVLSTDQPVDVVDLSLVRWGYIPLGYRRLCIDS